MPVVASNRADVATGNGAEAERMNRMPDGMTSSAPGSASREMMAGTALIQVMRRSAISDQNRVRWNRSSRTSARSGHQRGQQPDHLGVDVEQGQRVESPVARRELDGAPPRCAPCGAAGAGGAGSPWARRWSPMTPAPHRPEASSVALHVPARRCRPRSTHWTPQAAGRGQVARTHCEPVRRAMRSHRGPAREWPDRAAPPSGPRRWSRGRRRRIRWDRR